MWSKTTQVDPIEPDIVQPSVDPIEPAIVRWYDPIVLWFGDASMTGKIFLLSGCMVSVLSLSLLFAKWIREFLAHVLSRFIFKREHSSTNDPVIMQNPPRRASAIAENDGIDDNTKMSMCLAHLFLETCQMQLSKARVQLEEQQQPPSTREMMPALEIPSMGQEDIAFLAGKTSAALAVEEGMLNLEHVANFGMGGEPTSLVDGSTEEETKNMSSTVEAKKNATSLTGQHKSNGCFIESLNVEQMGFPRLVEEEPFMALNKTGKCFIDVLCGWMCVSIKSIDEYQAFVCCCIQARQKKNH